MGLSDGPALHRLVGAHHFHQTPGAFEDFFGGGLRPEIGISQQMQLIQPELDRIQRKYEGRDDQTAKMRQAQEMQALYNKYQINPASVMLVTFIQLPVIMAMYMSVQRSFAVATGSFLGINLQSTPMSGIRSVFSGDMSGLSLFLLWIVMGACQFISMKIPQILQKKKDIHGGSSCVCRCNIDRLRNPPRCQQSDYLYLE